MEIFSNLTVLNLFTSFVDLKILNNLPNLQLLGLIDCSFSEKENASFGELGNLKALKIRVNSLTSFNLAKLTSLKWLSLSDYENTRTLFTTLKTLNNGLQVLEINDGVKVSVQELFSEVRSCSGLKKFALRRNNKTYFDGRTLFRLPDLVELDFSLNQITGVQLRRRDCLRNLEKLNLSFNKFKEISDESFRHFNHLKWLNLSNNPIEVIRRNGLKGLDNLEFFALNHTKLKRLDFNITHSRLGNLTRLEVTFSALTSINAKAFECLTNLTELDLSSNRNMRVMDEKAFHGLSRLKTLNLSYNSLDSISSKTFFSLISLERLYLNNNKLEVINLTVFEQLSNLIELDLSFNGAIILNVEHVANFESIKKLDLTNNSNVDKKKVTEVLENKTISLLI